MINENPVVTVVRVKGNLEPIGATLLDNEGTAVNLTGKSITFRMINESTGEVKVDDQPAVIDNPVTGEVRYNPAAADVDTVGRWAMYFRTDDAPQRRFPYDGAKYVLNIMDECRAN